jgi:hypothetical protein
MSANCPAAPPEPQRGDAAAPGPPPGRAPDELLARGVAGQARLPASARALHRAVLTHFACRGGAPQAADLAAAARELGINGAAALRVLAEVDLVHTRRDTGAVTVAYPFCGQPTAYRVRLGAGVQVWAMCAIDALGIPAMLDTDAWISGVDPVTGGRVEVSVTAALVRPVPAHAVVVLPTGGGVGRCADCVCPDITFHRDAGSARVWLTGRGIAGRVLSVFDAAAAGAAVFGGLLRRAPRSD